MNTASWAKRLTAWIDRYPLLNLAVGRHLATVLARLAAFEPTTHGDCYSMSAPNSARPRFLAAPPRVILARRSTCTWDAGQTWEGRSRKC